MNLTKFGARINISEHVLFDWMRYEDARYIRKHNKVEVPPTAEDWEQYRAAKAGFEAMRDYEWTEWGGPDYGTEVLPPPNRYEFEYLETHDEWIARCRALQMEGISCAKIDGYTKESE
jgi:hypothetical protein